MNIAPLSTLIAAEPATVIYLVTGTAGLLLSRLRTSSRRPGSSVLMHFCRESSREKLRQLSLIR
jgi:hypothetical protein